MTDERDPRLGTGMESGESGGSSEHHNMSQRAVSGRFPSINSGRTSVPGRFSQPGMPVVNRPSAGGAMPPSPPSPPSAGRVRGGRPGITSPRITRPVIHAQESVHAGPVQNAPVSGPEADVLNETVGALDGVLGASGEESRVSEEAADALSHVDLDGVFGSMQSPERAVPQEVLAADVNDAAGVASESVADAPDSVADAGVSLGAEDEFQEEASGADEALLMLEPPVAAPVSSESAEPMVSESAEPMVAEAAEPVLAESAGPVLAESAEPVLSESAESVLAESAEPVLAEAAEPVLAESAEPVLSESAEPMVAESAEPMVAESAEPVLSESAEPVLSEAAEPVLAEAAEEYADGEDEHDSAPSFVILPIPPELRQEVSLRDNNAYRRESRSLLRSQSWEDLVQLMQNVLHYAVWADMPEVRSSILTELAGIYLDKLSNVEKARETYQQLLRESPSDASALEFMEGEYRKAGDYKAIHSMYRRVVDATWDSDERIEYTRRASEIAEKELHQVELSVSDWEHLWSIGETGEEVQNSLMTVYREHGKWDRLAGFIRERCVDWKATQRLGLREVVEIYLSGLGDADKASETLKGLLEERPRDPLLLLQEIHVCRIRGDIDRLAELSRLQGLDKHVELDIHRAAAEVLWDKGERELAVQAYDSILQEVPGDRDALHAKELYFSEGGMYEQLCIFYEQRAEDALNRSERVEAVEYYEKSAEVAERHLFDIDRAISLYKRILELEPNNLEAHHKIIFLYGQNDDDAGVTSSMEALLSLSSRPAQRRELLSKLGALYLDKLEDYERAEECWQKVQAIDPLSAEVSEELSRVYAKKGDFEALDKCLTQQIRVATPRNLKQLAESKGRYLMQHAPGSAHTAAGWEIVLDCDCENVSALENLGEVLDKLERGEEMTGAWEQELRTLKEAGERVALGLRIADAYVDCGTHSQAVSAYLRVLCWDPSQESALSALESICTDSERGIVRAVLEVAATHCEDEARRCALLRRSLRFISKSEVLEQIQTMRRILVLGDRSIEPEFVKLCREAGEGEILCATWLRRAYETHDSAERERLLFDVARLYAVDLGNPSLAFTLLMSSAYDSEKIERLAQELEPLCDETPRWEEVVALLGCLTTELFEESQRRHAIEKRIEIFLNHLDSPSRALEEYCRLLSMYPEDAGTLSQIERLAHEKHLERQLLGIYGQLWDATSSVSLRAEISQKRYEIEKTGLLNPDAALGELILGYCLMPTSELSARLCSECANPDSALLCLPLLESAKLSEDVLDVEGVREIARLCEATPSGKDDAFALYCQILAQCPQDEDALLKMGALSQDSSHGGRYAQALRFSASRAHRDGTDAVSLGLYRKLADFYRDELHDLERSIDIERVILRIKPDCIESLEALIAWHESREEWPELRAELQQRILAGGTDEEKVSLWLRVVAISSEHLADVEGTFDGYAAILQIDETNAAAHAGIETLTGADIGPDVELRRLRLELKLADNASKPGIMLKIARLQGEELQLPDAACETLETLYRETGACGIGYEPLCRAYESMKAWDSLVKIMLEHADAQNDEDVDGAIGTLSQALSIVDSKIKDEGLSGRVVARLHQLDPENEEISERYLSSLRRAEDWQKYAEAIQNCIDTSASKSGTKSLLFELARVKALALDGMDDAIALYREINHLGTAEKNAYFGIATLALKKGDIDLYLSCLDQVLRILDPVWGAIFYCHMAEVCDEKDRSAQVAGYYRSARTLDPDNAIASDSLRSIGRRLKNWRTTSSILPVENERELSWSERSRQLQARASSADSPEEARIWLWKAIAVDHDNTAAWRELALLEQKEGRVKECYEASFGAYGSVERTTLPGPSGALQNAQLLYEVAQAADACGHNAKGEALLRKAYSLTHSYAPVAIAVGELEQDAGNIDKAYTIYDTILKSRDIVLDDKLRTDVLFRRGLIANILKNYPQALDDLRATVKASPLHYDALMAISKTYADMQQPLFALSSMQQGLIVTPNKTKRRGNIYYDMGKIWDDAIGDRDEAGIYYEGALDNGASNVDLIERSLELYKRAGRYHEALELADTLTKTTTNPTILASLWCTRGELSESISPEQATEAYDMALSYVPGIGRAFDGLERMLVARQEWDQLAELLNGRLEGDLTSEQQAAIQLRLADLYADKLGEQEKSRAILYRLLEESPTASVVERLLKMPQDDEEKSRVLYEKAIVYCSGCYDYALQLAQYHLRHGRALQAWAIMSPLRTLLQLDAQTKELLNDLKTRFEKSDAVPFDSIAKALPVLSDEQFAILDALRVLRQKLGSFGPASLDEVTTGASEVPENTPNGKIFFQMRTGLEMDNVVLYRATELPEAIVVLDTDPVVVCIRTEIFQKAAGNELQFWLAKSLGLAHPDVRFVASAPESYRKALPKALLAAVGIGEVTSETAELVSRIKTALSADALRELRSQLTLYSESRLLACAETFSQEMIDSSDILGAYIVADMRTVWRAESRVDEKITEQRNVKTVAEIGKAIESSAILRKVLAYYVSEAFSEQLA